VATVAVIGAGGWGTALCLVLSRAGHPVRLWARRPELAARVAISRENPDYLPGARLPASVLVTTSLAEAAQADFALLAVPSLGLIEVARGLPRSLPVVSCAKGLGEGSRRLSEGLADEGFGRVAVLSGPNHAEEVWRALPAATVVASESAGLAADVQAALTGPAFRVYTSDDVAGVELGAASAGEGRPPARRAKATLQGTGSTSRPGGSDRWVCRAKARPQPTGEFCSSRYTVTGSVKARTVAATEP